MLTNNKELREVLRDAGRYGWVFSKRNKHIKGTHPSGRTATVSVSPGDGRAILNIRRDLRL